ncbi:MAG: bifunctional [glutamate--ammonia ligase]-adenylyl-L-tyrosine phosphorylase/[glutamate--ammonia-ligase] adenylyltransferase [Verrucomicrobia bacterium]|nr:MAG: bifunctional [glutamate--ammonia ligase]-adenylyl-L-tyrosine phosphorylase/[glutamate--ammonia-ligase] adenylyltransferase [Verrucomicrobiota bacterium]
MVRFRGIFRVMESASWIKEKSAASLYPAQVETTLIQLNEAWPVAAGPLPDAIQSFPLGEAALLHLFAVSSICAARIVQNPELLLWLSQPEICRQGRDHIEMANELYRAAKTDVAVNNFQILHRWKNKEMTRIALRELANAAALEETTAELSQLAEICVREVFAHWNAKFRKSFGSPTADFAILALGKLGGHELNHSSDVDLIFLYSEEGELSPRLSYHQWFNRLAEKILETFSTRDPEGALFRIDLRLRPEGSTGPLARSLESMENYYAGFGETWERIALIKAREIAGSRELAYEFLSQHQPFIYPRSPTPDLLDEVANIKRRIEREALGTDELDRDVKLGRGGIREIEFVVQTLQFIHGGRHAFLQETSTMKALRALAELELIPQKEVVDLDRAYRFLRQVEHRLQIEAEQQTHTVPRDPVALKRLARSLGFDSANEFSTALKKTMQNVRSIFDRVISSAPAEGALPDLRLFKDEKSAVRSLEDLLKPTSASHVAPRTKQIFRKLRPILLAQMAEAADPDAVLNQFVRFVEAYGLRGLLFELLATNPTLLELMIKTLDASRFAGDLLIRRPQLVEEITRDKHFNQPRSIAEHCARLESFGSSATNLDPVRAYRQRQLLRIIMRDVLGVAEASVIFAELSDLAESCLTFTNKLLSGENVTIVALGKFGGGELSYGADLDVLFVGEETRAAQNLVAAVTQPSSEGTIAAVDARLRPDGEKGPLVAPLAAYESYYRERAQLWEIHALTRARPISGQLQDAYLEMVQRIWRGVGQQSDLFAKIDHMLERIRRERGSGSDFLDLKTGTGGMIEAEFLVQALQMRSGIWEPNWQRALIGLREIKMVSDRDASNATQSYEVLRRTETALRRFENKNVSTLPSAPEEQEKLAKRLGYKDVDLFAKQYRAARETIHALYDRYLKARLS